MISNISSFFSLSYPCKILVRFKVVFLASFIIFFLIHMILYGTNLNLALYLAICSLVGIAIAFGQSDEIFFFMAFLSLCSSMIFLLIGELVVGEKLALWTVLTLTAGLSTSLYHLRFGRRSKQPIFIFRKVAIFINESFPTLKIIKFFKFLNAKLYGNPKRPFEQFLSAFRLFIYVVGILVILQVAYAQIFIPIKGQVRQYLLAQQRITMNPKIVKIEPWIVYASNTVVVSGSNMGWPQNENVRLMSQYGPVNVTVWTDRKIIFTIPLHWKKGELYLWIEKPLIWQGSHVVAKSNIYNIRLISTSFGKWNSQDNAYFEQINQLDKDVRDLNGYR